MNWFKQNRTLGVYLLLVLCGCGFLAFKLLAAQGRLEESMDLFAGNAQELNRLKGLAPFPEKKSLEAVEAQSKEFASGLEGLRGALRKNQLPLETVTEVEFQDRLKETVERITAAATKAGVALPEKFYMGFDQYQAEPPRKNAASPLARQLKAIEWILAQMIESRVLALERIERTPLPEEGEKVKGAKDGKASKPALQEKLGAGVGRSEAGGRLGKLEEGGAKGEVGRRDVERSGVDFTFRSTQASFQKTLNDLTSSKVQFYIPTHLEVRNEKEKGPARDETKADAKDGEASVDGAGVAETPGVPGAAAQQVAAAAGTPARTGTKAGKGAKMGEELRYIVGEENLVVDLGVDIVNFPEPKPNDLKGKLEGKGK
jgi:hypothetical protein